ncbi:MAG: glycosyltransferase [Muribaculum sp.]|nr:glycosyltransferase [Muribaculum sp.]
MKILVLSQYNPYIESSATANRLKGLLDGIRNCGHEVTIGIVGGKLSPEEKDSSGIVYLSSANHYNGIVGRMNTYIFDNLQRNIASYKLKRELKKEYDVVWLGNSDCVLDLYLKNKNKITGKSFIELNEFDNIHEEKGAIGNWLQRRKAIHRQHNFGKVISLIDLFAIMTQTLLTYYKDRANSNAKFIHLPMTVDLARFENISDEVSDYKQPYIAYTGTFNNNKDGVDILIKAFAKIAPRFKDLHLYLAGFWHYDVDGQKKIIEEKGLNDRVSYIGKLNSNQIPSFISNANLLVLSRPDSHQAQGGFPTKLGEYLATGNPVCVTKVGEIPNYLRDNVSAFLAEPGDVESFADAMERALCNPEQAKQVGLNGRNVAETEFNSKLQAERLVKFLESNIE